MEIYQNAQWKSKGKLTPGGTLPYWDLSHNGSYLCRHGDFRNLHLKSGARCGFLLSCVNISMGFHILCVKEGFHSLTELVGSFPETEPPPTPRNHTVPSWHPRGILKFSLIEEDPVIAYTQHVLNIEKRQGPRFRGYVNRKSGKLVVSWCFSFLIYKIEVIISTCYINKSLKL